MLAARFGMKYRREVRSTEALLLALAKGGIKAKPTASESATHVQFARDAGIHFEAAAASAGLADLLRERTRDLVIDRTGLEGFYLFVFGAYPLGRLSDIQAGQHLTGRFEDNLAHQYAEALAPLGLRLDPGKVQLENVVIDHMEHLPTEN